MWKSFSVIKTKLESLWLEAYDPSESNELQRNVMMMMSTSTLSG